jgi:hypothetical protein
MAEQAAARPTKRQGKEGNRWVNARPSGDEIATWFKGSVPIADGLDAEDYVAGITLIPNREKSEELVGWNSLNSPVLQDFYDLVLTPYMRVETRVKYFHDLCAKEGWVGFIEPVELAVEASTKGLPPGYFRHRVGTGPETGVNFLGCSMRVIAYERDTLEYVKLTVDKRTGEERIVRTGTVRLEESATKTVPTLNSRDKVDINAVMKVETGATGRALGLAGVLVIPGTGIATAEDLQESNQQIDAADRGADFESATLPDEQISPPEEIETAVAAETVANDAALRERATVLITEMKALPGDEGKTFEEFKAWAQHRGFVPLSDVVSPALRGLVRRAEAMLEEAKKAPPAPALPAEPTDPLES